MKFVKFFADEKIKWGILNGNRISEITGDIYSDDYYEIDNFYLADEVEILAPCDATKVVAVGLNYLDHIKEMGNDIPSEPVFFIKPESSIIGHKKSIVIPKMSSKTDYEAELAIVIKKDCKNVEADKAFDYILGYTCLNDVTARDLQKKDGQWTRAKGFDTFCPIGPCISTDIDANNLDIRLVLNGEVKQKSNTSNFLWKTNELVSFISKVMTLKKGDVITTGTTSGIGALSEGDEVKVEIENIGTLINYVTKEV